MMTSLPSNSTLPRRQQGVVLVVALVLLVAITLLSLAGISTTTLELQMATNQQERVNAFQQAEAGIDGVVSNLNNFPVTGPVGAERCTTDFDDTSKYYNATDVDCGSYDIAVPAGFSLDYSRAAVERMASKYGEMSVIKASIELQEHKEQTRGVPLVLARIRLVTDRGYFTADGEGYGASHALRLAANAVERQLLKGKTYGQSKKHPDTDEQEQLYGWWLGG